MAVAIISEKSVNSEEIYQMTLPMLLDSTKTVGRIERGDSTHLPNLCCGYQSTLICMVEDVFHGRLSRSSNPVHRYFGQLFMSLSTTIVFDKCLTVNLCL